MGLYLQIYRLFRQMGDRRMKKEREILVKLIEDGKDAERKLAALDNTPELRRWDYGTGENGCGDSRFRIVGADFEIYDGLGHPVTDIRTSKNVWLGNLADDLERNSKDLEKFVVTAQGAEPHGFEAHISDNLIYISCGGENEDYYCFDIDETTEIYQQLGQMIAFVKRQQNA